MNNRRKTQQQRQRTTRRPAWLPFAIIGGVVALVIVGVLLITNQGSGSAPRAIARMQTRDFHALMFSGADMNTVFFGHHGGLMVSKDQGETWQPTSLQGADAMSLGSATTNPLRMYAAGHGVFFRSDDAGKTWAAVAGQMVGADIHAFAASPNDANRVYALVAGQGLASSGDGGATWQPIASPSGAVTALAASGAQTVLAGTSQTGVFKSEDGGNTWQPISDGLGGVQVTGLALSSEGTIFASTSQGLYRRTANAAWQPLLFSKTLLAVAVSPLNGQLLLALSNQGEIFRSRDGGQTWGG